MNNPIVSIIIPTYNRAHFIGETLESVIAQTYQNWECIVIDDGSTDYTEELMEFYSQVDARIQYHHRPAHRPKGANACRNYGFELSTGEYINWFDSDDLMHHNKINIQVSELLKNKYSVSLCQNLIFDENPFNILGHRSKEFQSCTPFEDYLKTNIVWLTPSFLILKEKLFELDYLFDEELKAAQEWEFFSRFLFLKPKIVFTNVSLDFIRKHKESISYDENNFRIKNLNYFLARFKIYQNEYLFLNSDCKMYLKDFLLNYFKFFLKRKFFKESWLIFRVFILFDNSLNFKIKIISLLSLVSYFLTGRGYLFLRTLNIN
ncbi:glycosyltransferase family 2 protein [Zunongwangia sp. HGR-M22]|uniref:glycosyltransferase family 2 protein n=1 Tax=Zunongwangia sp. HGR-M22 TaxID=3015168 RepID=UPI0022DD25DA|nr:glycosyltransferase family 2 protein [Zunongwangia sp. HGR-M22]WBL24867.1 glycosyltransferase family 2 protein [Zunongwangia sp. HGR-M22]